MNQTTNLSDNPTVGELHEALSHFNDFDHVIIVHFVRDEKGRLSLKKSGNIASISRAEGVVRIERRGVE